MDGTRGWVHRVPVNEIKIEVSLKGPKSYVGKITGTDETYGFALEFAEKTNISRAYAKATITEPGCYRVPAETVISSRRIDSGYVRVNESGVVTEIAKADVTY